MRDGTKLTPDSDSVSARLTTPRGALPLGDLPGVWFHAHVETLCPPPRGWTVADLVDDPALPGRLRGAWGRQLLRTASRPAQNDRPCPWSPPCAYDPLFRDRPALKGLETPKPYVIAVTPGPDGLICLRLTLFGFATEWLEAAAEAWTLALRGGVGMPDGVQAVLEPLDRRITAHESLPAPPPPAAVTMRFTSPLCLRRGGSTHAEIGSLFSSLGNRVSGMARWLDAQIAADWRGLKDHAAGLAVDAAGLTPVFWRRYSGRQGDNPIRMEGMRGAVRIAGDLAPLWPLLLAGETCHVGSHAAQGLGRYVLEPAGE